MIFLKRVIKKILSGNRWVLLLSNDLIHFCEINHSEKYSRADCFVVEEEKKKYVFFEEFLIENNRKGYLAVAELINNKLINKKIVLKEKIHLSYPHVFKFKDDYYLIPETSAKKNILLYKFTQFPEKIIFVKELIKNITAVDSTILFMNDNSYLFTNKKINGNFNSNLVIYSSEDLLKKPFKKIHELNYGEEYSRMAGSFFVENGLTYRASQNCKIDYGTEINLFLLKKLNENKYEEVFFKTIKPPKGYQNLHTIAKGSNFYIVDAIKTDYSIKNILKNISKLTLNCIKKLK